MPNSIVVKLGASVLDGARSASSILDILASYEGKLVVVVSAFRGVADSLAAARERLPLPAKEAAALLARLARLHEGFLAALDPPAEADRAARAALAGLLPELRVLLEGAGGADRMARIASFGDRLAAPCVAAALAAVGRRAEVLEPGRVGLVAEGPWEEAVADLEASAYQVGKALGCRDAAVVPGSFGVGSDGLVRLFGRRGSDYSAVALALCLGARCGEPAQDPRDRLAADPSLVPEARRPRGLSHREAARLARGGARILQPRAARAAFLGAAPAHSAPREPILEAVEGAHGRA
ncbi:MAG TPA: hypothetical protein PLB91_14195 [Spirochaetales bacterium]|nr:hypothetical protein [Spirochaetales bacterium]HRY55349.1 hypothetical protein [Spirochaetia bacterium]HRZ63442.1 hypothetical protein [Spirochaetia bacterium]